MHRNLFDRLVALGVDLFADERIRPKEKEARKRFDDTVITLRESAEYRFSSILFHAGLLRDFQERAVREMTLTLLGGSRDGYEVIYIARRQQQMLFDAMVFNSLALFDYLGNMIGFAFYGADSGAWKWQWKRATTLARKPQQEEKDYGGTRYSSSEIAGQVIEIDREWISRLQHYRGELIHIQADPAGGHYEINATDGQPPEILLEITVPEAFAKKIRLPGTQRGERVGLIRAGDWLIIQSYTNAVRVIDSLRDSLGVYASVITP
ncbi:MAG: hypothetical protein ABW277_08985 [Longimicrobiaceae bacterium]